MIDAARATGRCAQVVLCTNGVALPWAGDLGAWARRLGAPLTIKLSVNHHLLEQEPRLIDKAGRLARACDAAGATLVLNVRRRRDPAVDDDARVVEAVRAAGLLPRANVFFLQRYGLARDDARLEPPFLVGTDFTLANPDGTTWGADLLGRSDAMEALP